MRVWAALLAFCGAFTGLRGAEPPIAVKVVIVSMFEVGEDSGDRPGEFQFWVEREKLTKILPFPAGNRPLRASADGSVLGVVTGVGVTNATSAIMALGLDPRFDFSKTYWLIAGIAGVDPADASLGSAAWADYVMDGDLVYELDAREAPAEWPYSRIAVGSKGPGKLPDRPSPDTLIYQLNPKLVEWAFQLTRGLKLADTPAMASFRASFEGFPNAQRPPFVLKGGNLGSSTFWHGKALTQWANDWMKLWTKDAANFVMTNMEDNGTATALKRLDRLHKVDFQRVLVLRTASNYCMPAPNQAAAASLLQPFAGFLPSLESAYLVGSTVVHDILNNWPQRKERIPGE